MGSFNATCIISNLQIEHGTPVRFLALTASAHHSDGNEHICYVGGRWQIRCPPIRAKYNDYGSIENLKKRLCNRVFFESLNHDCVEKGVGDNQCHDVQVRRGMTTKQWLEALWEGRVYVTDYQKNPNWPPKNWKPEEPPVGMPSMTRIEKVLKDNDLPVVTAWGAKGFFIDEVSRGFIRIRHGRDYTDSDENVLGPVVPLLEAAGYAAMVTCGTGMYSNPAEILVAPKPVPKGAKDAHGQGIHFHTDGLAPEKDRNRPRPVSQAMIREDVWQILLKTPISHFRGDFTFADMQKAANAALDEEKAWKAEEAAWMARDPKTIPKDEAEVWAKKVFRHYTNSREDMKNHFRSCLHAHEGVSGFSLRQAFELGMELSENQAELEGFIQDMAETAYVQVAYDHLHGQWHPTTNSSQDGMWKEHRAFMASLMKIKGHYEDE
jgi:hypothetical protein